MGADAGWTAVVAVAKADLGAGLDNGRGTDFSVVKRHR